MSALDEPCSRCVAELTSPAAQFRVIWQGAGEEIGPEESARLFSVMAHGYLHERVALMRRALASAWPMELNGMHRGAVLPVTTWHGDPICEVHLYEAWQAEREPRTVKMAQWRR